MSQRMAVMLATMVVAIALVIGLIVMLSVSILSNQSVSAEDHLVLLLIEKRGVVAQENFWEVVKEELCVDRSQVGLNVAAEEIVYNSAFARLKRKGLIQQSPSGFRVTQGGRAVIGQVELQDVGERWMNGEQPFPGCSP